MKSKPHIRARKITNRDITKEQFLAILSKAADEELCK